VNGGTTHLGAVPSRFHQDGSTMSAFDLAVSVRNALARARSVSEVKMFGGIGFMLNGNLLVGASSRGLLVRVGKERQAQALAQPGARPMVMRGRAMEGYITIDPPALDDAAVLKWIELARSFVRTLPPKPVGAKPKRSKR
jgi:TfoX/Sxy family transcriptional regulator of competence genes